MDALESIHAGALAEVLPLVLASAGQNCPADRAHVDAFREYLERCPVRWEGYRSCAAGRTTGLLFALLLPGRTAVVLIPPPGELNIQPTMQRAVVEHGLQRLRAHRPHYVQALLEPADRGRRSLVESAGFRHMATLTYLERSATFPWFDPPHADDADWARFGPDTYGEFAATLEATYEGSLDCPGLTGLRPIDDTIRSHQASGPFDPAFWELARICGENVGCLLLTRLAHGPLLEIVYTGVVPRWRCRGIGRLLLRRALERCREAGARRLTVVVDERNTPAQRLYDSFGFEPVATRDAYVYRWGQPVEAGRAGR